VSRHGDITLPWGDGEYTFRLDYGKVRTLQETCKAGPPVIMRRLRDNEWYAEDVRETVRHGLIGGGKTQDEALGLIQRFVDGVPYSQNRMIALLIWAAWISGDAEEAVGKTLGARKTRASRRSPKAASASPISMPPASPSASSPPTLMP
jgi:hypothetical protein